MADVIVWDNGAVTSAGPGYTAEGLVEEWHRDHPNVETKPYDIVPEETVPDHPKVLAAEEKRMNEDAGKPDKSNDALLKRIEALENK